MSWFPDLRSFPWGGPRRSRASSTRPDSVDPTLNPSEVVYGPSQHPGVAANAAHRPYRNDRYSYMVGRRRDAQERVRTFNRHFPGTRTGSVPYVRDEFEDMLDRNTARFSSTDVNRVLELDPQYLTEDYIRAARERLRKMGTGSTPLDLPLSAMIGDDEDYETLEIPSYPSLQAGNHSSNYVEPVSEQAVQIREERDAEELEGFTEDPFVAPLKIYTSFNGKPGAHSWGYDEMFCADYIKESQKYGFSIHYDDHLGYGKCDEFCHLIRRGVKMNGQRKDDYIIMRHFSMNLEFSLPSNTVSENFGAEHLGDTIRVIGVLVNSGNTEHLQLGDVLAIHENKNIYRSHYNLRNVGNTSSDRFHIMCDRNFKVQWSDFIEFERGDVNKKVLCIATDDDFSLNIPLNDPRVLYVGNSGHASDVSKGGIVFFFVSKRTFNTGSHQEGDLVPTAQECGIYINFSARLLYTCS